MKARITSQYLLAALLLACLADSVRGQSFPFPPIVSVRASYAADLGASGYTFSVRGLSSLASITLRAPDGTLFGAAQPSLESLTLSEITSRFVGEWNFLDASSPLPGGEPLAIPYAITALDLTMFPTSTPQIFSPQDGAHLPAEFEFQATTSFLSMRGGNSVFSSAGSFKVDLSKSAGKFPLIVESRVSVNKTNRFDLVSLGGTPAREVRMEVLTTNLSSPVTWTIGVPEPSTLALGSLALLSLAVLRRRK